MQTIAKHISSIRGLIKSYGRNPEGYTDEGLYGLFSVSRAEVLKNQLKKFDAIHDDNWYQICMGLSISKSHNCDCVPDHLECKILKSNYKLPTVLVGNNTSKLRVRLISGKVVNIISEDDWFRRKDKETQEYFGSIVNSYLILWNVPLSLKAILLTGIWSDITQLESIPNCSEDGTEHGLCFNPMDMLFPLQDEYARPVWEYTLKLMNIGSQMPQDQTNDSNEFIKL
jgi:hypothetical protein